MTVQKTEEALKLEQAQSKQVQRRQVQRMAPPIRLGGLLKLHWAQTRPMIRPTLLQETRRPCPQGWVPAERAVPPRGVG